MQKFKITIHDSSNSINVKINDSNQYIVKTQRERGQPGKSAYSLALDNGFVGTYEEWAESLIGKSAYEIALDNGFVGTEQQWLDSLKTGIEFAPEDTGKILSTDGSTIIWVDLAEQITQSNITLDFGEF